MLLGGAAAAAGAALALAPDTPPEAPAEPPAAEDPPAGRFATELDVAYFHKGNLHTHSLESDGDSLPADVYRWYRSHGYQFVALTDHDKRIDPRVYRWLERPSFKILPGEEVTMAGAGSQVHVNALCTKERIGGGGFRTKAEALDHALRKIEAQGGIALINHPNFDRSLTADDLWHGRAAPLLEIMSGHPYVYSNGVDDRPSHERLWSELLTRGAMFHGVAVDDTHHLAPGKSPEKTARPGRGWIATYADRYQEVEVASTCEAIRAGRFYASSGAAIDRLRVSDTAVTVWPEDRTAYVVFLGPGDEVLGTVPAGAEGAKFKLRGGERWVRARVEQQDGSKAWTQPFRVVYPE